MTVYYLLMRLGSRIYAHRNAQVTLVAVCWGLNVSPAFAKSDPVRENDPGNGSERRSHNTQPAL